MFIRGVDISSLQETEEQGGVFYANTKKDDALKILKNQGINSIRLRLWVDPYDEEGNSYGGGSCDIDTTINLAKRAKSLGMSFLLDLHYSDFWADPSKQFKPKSWQGLDFDELKDKVYQYTKNILTTLKNNNIEPEYVQIGNEITAGMLWEEGKLIWKDGQVFGFDNLALLLKAGVKAVQDTSESKIILHLERSADNALYRQWFDNIISRDVYFDIIGVSYYPYWHGTLDDMQNNLNDMIDRYKKDILVVETSYAYTLQDFDQRPDNYTGLVINKDFASKDMPYPFTPQGQAEYLWDLFLRIRNLKDKRGLGIYYWEPCWIPTPDGTWASPKAREYIKETHKGHGNEWANQALFDYNGKMNYALKIYNKF